MKTRIISNLSKEIHAIESLCESLVEEVKILREDKDRLEWLLDGRSWLSNRKDLDKARGVKEGE